ncbi:MAG: hypothetical protein GF388_06870, partial [Candidatus Aegiribacteria sp.]|nr:hypothetical protein [Candidatus Aegiribacteria sp.]
MAEELSFSIRDIPSCARYGFSARKIWLYFKKLVLSWLIWDIFIYLGYFAAGSDMAARWNAGRLLPLPGSLFWTDPVPVVFLIIASVLILYVLMRGSLAVSKLAFQQIRGDDFYSVSDAESFASRHHVPLFS